MAAPSIPNLNTLRSGRGRGRGRGGLNGLEASSSREDAKTRHDQIIQQTDVDAAVSRLSAVKAGYLDDAFAPFYASATEQNRLPIINRGTYVRTTAIDRLLLEFLESNPAKKKQIISLGAGTDTRFFRFKSRFRAQVGYSMEANWVYHDLDFEESLIRKVKHVMRESSMAGCIGAPCSFHGLTDTIGYDCIVDCPNYHTHPVDLRELDPAKVAPRTFGHIDPKLPTIIISECCLCYLQPAAADTVALYFTKHFFPESTPVGLIIYEPIKPNDAFGKTMVSNLGARGIELQTLRRYGSLEAQRERLRSYGLLNNRAADVNRLWREFVSADEKERVAGLEMLDEVEEWELLAGHYCVAWGWRDGDEAEAIGGLHSWQVGTDNSRACNRL